MALTSTLFTADGPGKALLKRCSETHAGHFFRGMPQSPGVKDAVGRIQTALGQLGFATSDPSGTFGQSTAEAVQAFKGPPRNILGPGQRSPDPIVGIQTIARLDADIQASPAPSPVVDDGSTNWQFSFFGNKGFTGKGIYSLSVTSLQKQNRGEFDIVENFSDGSLMAGFKGEARGTFTTQRKMVADEFASAACKLSLVKVPLQPFLQGHMEVRTIGDVSRQLTILLQIPSLKDETLGTTLTTGSFQMHGTARRH